MNAGPQDVLEEVLTAYEVRQFLYREAQLLDDSKLEEWFSLFAEDVRYRAPRRIQKETLNDVYSDDSYYFDEDWGSLQMRVKRYSSEYAWAERPPSKTRRVVGNVQIRENDDDTVEATNNVMIYIDREETIEYTFVTAERRDRLRRTDHGFEITDREIFLDSDIWPSAKISIFL